MGCYLKFKCKAFEKTITYTKKEPYIFIFYRRLHVNLTEKQSVAFYILFQRKVLNAVE